MSQAVDILYVTFNISKRLKNNTVRSWVVYILLACVKHVHARILPLRAKVCARRTILTPPPFVKVRLPSKGSVWSYICVLGASLLPLSTIFLLNYGTVPTVWYALFFISSIFLEIVNNGSMQKNTQCNGQNKMKRRNRQQNTHKNILTLSVPDEGYSRNALNLKSTFHFS
jgi:hypothetical protein